MAILKCLLYIKIMNQSTSHIFCIKKRHISERKIFLWTTLLQTNHYIIPNFEKFIPTHKYKIKDKSYTHTHTSSLYTWRLVKILKQYNTENIRLILLVLTFLFSSCQKMHDGMTIMPDGQAEAHTFTDAQNFPLACGWQMWSWSKGRLCMGSWRPGRSPHSILNSFTQSYLDTWV